MRNGILDIYYNGDDFEFNPYTGVRETNSIVNMIILGIFGGNVEESEPVNREAGQIVQAWWGNRYGYNENSETERLLRNITLSSKTPPIVKRTVLSDLSFLSEWFEIDVTVTIPTVNRINIDIYLTDKKTRKGSNYLFIWDTLGGSIVTPGVVGVGFNYSLNFSL